jgi:hypothetical protein
VHDIIPAQPGRSGHNYANSHIQPARENSRKNKRVFEDAVTSHNGGSIIDGDDMDENNCRSFSNNFDVPEMRSVRPRYCFEDVNTFGNYVAETPGVCYSMEYN